MAASRRFIHESAFDATVPFNTEPDESGRGIADELSAGEDQD
jgi:hypothetical protein